MKKILVAGDWHGNVSHVAKTLKLASAAGIDTIVQLGDFEYWEHTDKGKYYLDWIGDTAPKRGVDVYFIDGNHENHPMLWDTYKSDHRFWQLRDNLYYIPRGRVWTWDGVTFAAMGGAVSIDRDDRITGESWWPTEQVTQFDLEVLDQAVTGQDVDVLFAHDAPINPVNDYFYKDDPVSTVHRQIMHKVASIAQPRLWMHGHYHMYHQTDKRMPYGWLNIIGLDCDAHHKQLKWDMSMAVLTDAMVRFPALDKRIGWR